MADERLAAPSDPPPMRAFDALHPDLQRLIATIASRANKIGSQLGPGEDVTVAQWEGLIEAAMQEEFPAVVTPIFKTMAPNEQMAQVANFAAFLDEIGPEADAHPLAGSAVGKRVHRYGRPRGQRRHRRSSASRRAASSTRGSPERPRSSDDDEEPSDPHVVLAGGPS